MSLGKLTKMLLHCGCLLILTLPCLRGKVWADDSSDNTDNVKEIIVYNWLEDIPQSVLDAFTQETKIKVNCKVFNSQEEAVASLREHQEYDVAVIDGRFVPALAREGLLKRLNYQNILNFKYTSPNFRGLVYDPDNRFSVP